MAANNCLQTPFVGSGVRQDLHRLFVKFDSLESYRIADYGRIFREMKFDSILKYRQSPSEYVEFAEYILHYASNYFRAKNESYEWRKTSERVFGVYTCYVLYNIQPTDHVCQIQVTTQQVDELIKFEKQMIKEKHEDVVACIHSLISKKAFHITLFQSSYDPSTHKKYLAEEENVDVNRGSVVPFERLTTLIGSDLFNEMSFLHKSYVKGKRDLGISEPTVCMVDHRDPLEEAQVILRRNQKMFEINKLKQIAKRNAAKTFADNVEEVDDEMQMEESAGTSRSHLKSKAYSANMKHTRNRRYLDPNMQENFGHLTFGQIAQELLNEQSTSADNADETMEEEETVVEEPTKRARPTPRRRKRKDTVREMEEQVDDHALAEEVLKKNLAGMHGVMKEEPVDNPECLVGGKKSKRGTVSTKVRAPKKNNEKRNIIEVEETGNKNREQPESSASVVNSLDNSSPKKPRVKRMQLDDVWTDKLRKLSAAEKAADKTLERLKSRIKLEDSSTGLD